MVQDAWVLRTGFSLAGLCCLEVDRVKICQQCMASQLLRGSCQTTDRSPKVADGWCLDQESVLGLDSFARGAIWGRGRGVGTGVLEAVVDELKAAKAPLAEDESDDGGLHLDVCRQLIALHMTDTRCNASCGSRRALVPAPCTVPLCYESERPLNVNLGCIKQYQSDAWKVMNLDD